MFCGLTYTPLEEEILRKTPLIAVGLAATLALGGTAVAQDDAAPGHDLQTSVSPAKAGTKKKPKNVATSLEISNNEKAGTTVKTIEIDFPKTIRMNTKGFKICSQDTIETEGPTACPKNSKLGTGTAAAVINPKSTMPAPINFKNTFFVGGKKKLHIYLEQTDGSVRKVLIGKIGKAGGKYGQKLTIQIPGDLQQPGPGVFSALTDIETKLKGTTGSGKKKHGFFESIGCKGGLYDFQTKLFYAPNPNPPAASKAEATDTVDCRK